MNITVNLLSPLLLRDLRQTFGIPLHLLPGKQCFVRSQHPRFPNTQCYIWADGVREGLEAGLSEAYLVTLWENGLEVDWTNFEPLSEKSSAQAA
jgi:hypothetical protein